VEYLMSKSSSIVEKIIEIMRSQEDGTVVQRFCIAILQKMSVKEEVIPIFLKYKLIDWIVNLLQRSKNADINVFCLDFSSALLANILHSNITLEYLEENPTECKNVTNFLKI
jgi:hypothetical protein